MKSSLPSTLRRASLLIICCLLLGQAVAAETNPFSFGPGQTVELTSQTPAAQPNLAYTSGGTWLPTVGINKNYWGVAVGKTRNMAFTLTVTDPVTVRMAASVAATIIANQKTGFRLSVTVGSTTVLSNQAYTSSGFGNVSWIVPASALTAGSNTVTLTVNNDSSHQTGMWINQITMATASIDFTVKTPKPTSSSFTYQSGGSYAGTPSPPDWAIQPGTNLVLGLQLTEAVPINMTLQDWAPGAQATLSVKANSTMLFTDYYGPRDAYTTLTFNIPAAALKTGANKIELIANTATNYVSAVSISPAVSELNLYNQLAAAPPDTYAVMQPDFDILAWNMFFAMNWPAIVPGDGSGGTPNNGYLRGFPDTGKTFVDSSHDTLLVWETFKGKSEMFIPPPGTTTPPAAWSSAPSYHNLGVASTVTYDNLNETVEVASEALEKYLGDGKTLNPVYQRPVAPRVYLGNPKSDQSNAVRYEVKVNYDFYKYLTKFNPPLYIDANAESIAKGANPKGPIQLPFRTNAASGGGARRTGEGAGTGPTYSYSAATTLNTYKSPSSGQDPPGIGSIHIKAAWIPTDEIPNFDETKYHTAMSEYYSGSDPTGQPLKQFALIGLHIIQRLHTMGEHVGGTLDTPGGSFIFATWEHVDNETAGFTYSNYYDPTLDPLAKAGTPPTGPEYYGKGFYPNITAGSPAGAPTAYPVTRLYDILPSTELINAQVHQAIKNANSSSIWLNYELIGVQFMGINARTSPKLTPTPNTTGTWTPPAVEQSDNDPTGIGLPVYLSNSVIETNVGLQQFQGTPPGTDVIAHYQGKKGTGSYAGEMIRSNSGPYTQASDLFHRDDLNLSFGGTGYNLGGCMGCHGVSQIRGYSFSFVLLGGQSGADADSEEKFSIPPLQTDKN